MNIYFLHKIIEKRNHKTMKTYFYWNKIDHSQPKSIKYIDIPSSGQYTLVLETHPFKGKVYHFAYFVTPTLKSSLVFLTEENPQRSQTSTIADTDNIFTYVGQK